MFFDKAPIIIKRAVKTVVIYLFGYRKQLVQVANARVVIFGFCVAAFVHRNAADKYGILEIRVGVLRKIGKLRQL